MISKDMFVETPAPVTGRTVIGWLTMALALSFVAFQIYTAGFGQFPPLVQRSIHVGLAIGLVYLSAAAKLDVNLRRWALAAAAAAALLACGYLVLNDERLTNEIAVAISPVEIVLGLTLLLLILDSARRSTGWILPIMVTAMLGYTLFGDLISGNWGHPVVSLEFMMEQLYLGTEGIWGTVTGLSASLISIFIIFGCFLLATGASETFMKVALIVAGRSPGGAAKVANVSSAMFGMINGAAVANVATVGNFTIPMMQRLGYRPAFAGAVEATASSGGQITPPVMGAGAFIMAELLRLPYLAVASAAVIPSFLFYVCIWASIDVEARREGLRPVDKADIPRWRDVLNMREAFPLAATILVMAGAMFTGRSAGLAAFLAIVTNVSLYMLLGSWDRSAVTERLRRLLEGARMGALNVVSLVSLLVCAQIILSLIGFTGVGIKLSELILGVGGTQGTFVTVFLVMIVAIVLGMGMPTTAAYLLAAAVCIPPMITLGLPPLSAHFFVFYGALLSALTPPVCTAVYTAAVITQTDWWPIAVESMKLAVMKFIMPFYFIFRPEILLAGSTVDIIRVLVVGVVASLLFSVATGGYYRRPVPGILRLALGAIALGTIDAGWITDILAVAALAGLWLWQRKPVVATA
ncbi:TRAP transporter permease [Ferrovibrio xuzhouensis]|uniref:TRAP transporter permease n=1 Tax=Ferrovibrio xuzhouensis TaxID=1576914 RepID=A0ABV7VLF2_9PROT